MNAYGASPWNEDATRCTADSPEMLEALGVFNGMVFEDGSSPVPGQQADFWGGQAGATTAFLGSSSLLEGATFDWDIVRTPGGPAGGVQAVGRSAIAAVPAGPQRDGWGGQAGATTAFLGSSSLLERATFDWDSVRTPGGPAGDVQAVGQSAIVALTAGEYHEAALDFLAYLTNRENAKRISQFFPPARDSLLNPEVLAESSGLLTAEDLEPIVESITERGQIFPVAPNGASVANALDSSLDEFVYTPDSDLDEALPKVCSAIE